MAAQSAAAFLAGIYVQFTPKDSSSLLPYVNTDHKDDLEDGESRTAISTFTQLSALSPGKVQVQCCFTSTETIRTIRDGEPMTATSTSTQLLSSVKRTAAEVFPLIIKFTRVPFCVFQALLVSGIIMN